MTVSIATVALLVVALLIVYYSDINYSKLTEDAYVNLSNWLILTFGLFIVFLVLDIALIIGMLMERKWPKESFVEPEEG